MPLDGTRVVDITEGIAGPYCSMDLGDSGAAVIKVERPRGDTSRGWGPPFLGDQSAVFLGLNRNKRSIALDWTDPRGQEVLRRLVSAADVFMEDLGVGQAEGLGLGHDALAATNPGLVSLSITAFGGKGPFAGRPGSELVAQAMSEVTASLGAIGDPPERVGTDVAGIYTGYYSFIAILSALFQRNRTGRGQRVSTSLAGSCLFMRSTLWTAHSNPDEWYGFHLDNYIKPRDHGYTAKDGQFFFTFMRPLTPDRWAGLLDDLGLSLMKDNPHWVSPGNEVIAQGRYGYIYRDVWDERFGQMTVDEITTVVERHGGNVWRFNNYEMLFAHPQTALIDMVEEVDHPTAGRIKMTGIPWKLGETPGAVRLPPPLLGQHTDEILREAGFSDAEINTLRNENVIT